ncbi:F510_1955 family glycosylhydrolase [Pseudonocardia sp. GCM10023141]|uniref:F510_1955 family glycosylhydrolase n=1 Tax=Pseudonocardia sp. GCM10023141 TaxID=3252653 RepID=UPI003616039B
MHGLANNPQNGTVYAATHTGLFRLGAVVPRRVNQPDGVNRFPDTMGFAVIGPNRFLASGHPGPGEGGPSNVGLLRSEDGGRTWVAVALPGQADFHALSVAGETVYGWDSATAAVMRSDDTGTTWQRGAHLPDVGSLAVDPDHLRRVLATTATGLLRSDDGGNTFALAPVQPPQPLVVLDHAPRTGGGGDTVLAGMDRTGTVWTSIDGTWSRGGSIGRTPQAFSVLGPQRYVVATDDGVHSTEDTGRTWKLLAASS